CCPRQRRVKGRGCRFELLARERCGTEHTCTTKEGCGKADHEADPLWAQDWEGPRGPDLVRTRWRQAFHRYGKCESPVVSQCAEDPRDQAIYRRRELQRHGSLPSRPRRTRTRYEYHPAEVLDVSTHHCARAASHRNRLYARPYGIIRGHTGRVRLKLAALSR